MSRWYRAYEGTVTDAKFGEVALVAECSRSVAIAAWHCILESCASVNDGGNFDATLRRVAVILCEPISTIEKVFAEFESLGLIKNQHVTAWSKRQFESDNSTARSKKHREIKGAAETAVAATPMQRCATPPETETYTDTEKKEKKEISPKQVRTSVSEEFENFWKACSAWRGHSGKKEAADEWRRLSSEDRLSAVAGVSGYSASLRVPNAPTPLHVCRFLKYRRFETYAANVLPFTAGSDPPKLSPEEQLRRAHDFDRRWKAGEFQQ